ncbi:MAG: hydroxymethylglutaryl-CoA lyase [Pseudomonadota bacterium]
MKDIDILVSEVGPRDGLQSIDTIMPTARKLQWIEAQVDAGFREIEVGSFVPPKLLPQLADTPEVVTEAKKIPGLIVAVLVPNLKGAENAVKTGAHKLTIPFSMSETHSLKNLRKTHDQMFVEIKNIRDLLNTLDPDQRPHFEVSLSTAFGCTLEGKVSEDYVALCAEKVMDLGADEVGLSDTTGYANPKQLTRMVKQIKSIIGNECLTGVHLHNTRGLGLANALAAIEVGITTLDSSLGGIGGCPFAPGASGNIVTEDLVFMLQAMGLKTGVDIDKLLMVRTILSDALPNESLYGFTPDAGLPLGFE